MKIQIVRDAKGNVLGASKVTPRDEGSVQAECGKGEKAKVVDVADDAMEDVKRLFKKYRKKKKK